MIKHIVLVLLLILWLGAFAAVPVMAQTCTTQYGGVTTCVPADLVISKEVKNPITSAFVGNLSTTDATFSPGSEVHFRLTIKNTSGQTFNPVTVKDIFPDFLTFEAGPGTYDASNRTLTFELDNVIAGETRTVELLAKVRDSSAFPTGRSFFCVVNTGRAQALDRTSEATSQLCIQTQVLGVTTLPAAGFEDVLVLIPFLTLGGIGVLLARKAI